MNEVFSLFFFFYFYKPHSPFILIPLQEMQHKIQLNSETVWGAACFFFKLINPMQYVRLELHLKVEYTNIQCYQ